MENVSIKLQRLKDACIERSERLEVANEQLNQELSECELIKSQIPTDLLIARNNLEEATLKMKFGMVINILIYIFPFIYANHSIIFDV